MGGRGVSGLSGLEDAAIGFGTGLAIIGLGSRRPPGRVGAGHAQLPGRADQSQGAVVYVRVSTAIHQPASAAVNAIRHRGGRPGDDQYIDDAGLCDAGRATGAGVSGVGTALAESGLWGVDDWAGGDVGAVSAGGLRGGWVAGNWRKADWMALEFVRGA